VAVGEGGAAALVDGGRGKRRRRESYLGRAAAGKFGGEADQRNGYVPGSLPCAGCLPCAWPRQRPCRHYAVRKHTADSLQNVCRVLTHGILYIFFFFFSIFFILFIS
jgi:hypothetical protein